MKNKFRLISLIIILVLVLTSLLSCDARPLAQTKLAKTVVGTVGSHDVLYEELYLLVNAALPSAKETHGDDTDAITEEVWKSVKENITLNYAIIDLCESEGLKYDEKELRKEVEDHIRLTIESSFDGSRGKYLDSQLAAGITDHYYRFSTGVDILYNKLATKYLEDGVVPNTDEKIKQTVKESFIHTWHITVFVNEGDDRATEYAKAQEALKLLEDGNSMFDLIGSKYNENTVPESLTDAYGYYFPKGIMEKNYEDAAFSLESVGDRTGIVPSYSYDANGNYCECFYIIEKLAVKDSEIEANFEYLADMLKDVIITQKLDDVRKELSFTPNDYALSLNLTSLEAPKNGADYTVIIAVIAVIVIAVATVVFILIFRSVRAKKFHKKHKK